MCKQIEIPYYHICFMSIPVNKLTFSDSSCENQVLFKDIHEHVSNDHKVWGLNLATKIDGKTFKVMYSGFIVGAR